MNVKRLLFVVFWVVSVVHALIFCSVLQGQARPLQLWRQFYRYCELAAVFKTFIDWGVMWIHRSSATWAFRGRCGAYMGNGNFGCAAERTIRKREKSKATWEGSTWKARKALRLSAIPCPLRCDYSRKSLEVLGYEAVLVISLTGRSAVYQVIKLYVEISRKNEYVAVRPPTERCMDNWVYITCWVNCNTFGRTLSILPSCILYLFLGYPLDNDKLLFSVLLISVIHFRFFTEFLLAESWLLRPQTAPLIWL